MATGDKPEEVDTTTAPDVATAPVAAAGYDQETGAFN